MKDLHSKFKDSGIDIGLTFTAPSSYWYMRWFDLSGMLKYADWMNFVSKTDDVSYSKEIEWTDLHR